MRKEIKIIDVRYASVRQNRNQKIRPSDAKRISRINKNKNNMKHGEIKKLGIGNGRE